MGSYLPKRRLTNADLESMVDTSDEWIRSRTGIGERRLVDEGQTTSDLAAEAIAIALADADVAPRDVDLLILATSSPDLIFPSTATLTQDKAGLSCAAYDVMAACTGFVYALHAAASAIEAGRARRVVVVGADAFSRFVDFEDRTTCILFGDGAGALVLEPSTEAGVLGIDLGADGSGLDMLYVPGGGAMRPASEQTVRAREHFVKMRGNDVFKFAVRAIPETVRAALDASEVVIDDVRWVVPHQANQRIIDTMAERLDVEPERVVSNIEWVGNTSTASIPLAMDGLYTSGDLNLGDHLVLVGFGAGLTWGSAVVRWTRKAV
jgi:3-oxoacyl-[acyl-carrier-protein] synthase-3